MIHIHNNDKELASRSLDLSPLNRLHALLYHGLASSGLFYNADDFIV